MKSGLWISTRTINYKLQIHTCEKVQGQDHLTLCFPSWSLDVRFINIILAGQCLFPASCNLASLLPLLPLAQHLFSPLLYFRPFDFHHLLCLLLLHLDLDDQNEVPQRCRDCRNCKQHILKQKHNHHIRPRLLINSARRITHKRKIIRQRHNQTQRQSCMKAARIRRRLLLQHLHPSMSNPSPNSPCHQRYEHGYEPCADFIPEYGHGEACLCDGKPSSFVELLDFYGAEAAVEEAGEGPYD